MYLFALSYKQNNFFLLDKRIFRSTSRHAVHNNVFSTWNKLINLKTWTQGMECYTDWKLTMSVVAPVISLLANSNNSLGVRICSQIGLCKLTWAVNLFKVSPAPSQGEKPETYAGILLSWWTEQLRITIPRAYSYI